MLRFQLPGQAKIKTSKCRCPRRRKSRLRTRRVVQMTLPLFPFEKIDVARPPGYACLPIEQIQVGQRHRKDMGDIAGSCCQH